MSEIVTETPKKDVSWTELGWATLSCIMLLTATVGMIYSLYYKEMGNGILVPTFAAFLMAIYMRVEYVLAVMK